MHSRVESGVELLARLISRPTLSALRSHSLIAEIQSTDAIEISGGNSTGKTLLLHELLGRCILPTCSNGLEINGCNASVVLINTDQQFSASKFMELMSNLIYRECICQSKNEVNAAKAKIKNIVRDSLDKLIVLDCYGYEEFVVGINSLTDVLLKNRNIALVAVDSITAHYWQYRQIYGTCSTDNYTKKCLKLIRTSTSRCKVATVYTRSRDADPESFRCTIQTILMTKSLELPTTVVQLQRLRASNSVFSCTIQKQGLPIREYIYEINESGIIWGTESKRVEEANQGNKMN